jgi:hypothetical protein
VSGDEKVIRIISLINGGTSPFDGQWVVEYDPGRGGIEPGTGTPMLCHLVTTPLIAEAARYDAVEAVKVWLAVDPEHPVRPDGKPNRPLTAFTVEVEPAPQNGNGKWLG